MIGKRSGMIKQPDRRRTVEPSSLRKEVEGFCGEDHRRGRYKYCCKVRKNRKGWWQPTTTRVCVNKVQGEQMGEKSESDTCGTQAQVEQTGDIKRW